LERPQPEWLRYMRLAERAAGYNVAAMEPIRETGRWLVFLGIVLVAVGGLLMVGGRLPLRLGRLPGDIVYHGRNTTVYFPIVTSIVLSVGLTLVLWLISALRR
jgi:hypothetical protein